MKIAILGGGFTGLTAAYYLIKKNHQVTVFEKEKILGGLASGFKSENWDWYLEKTYHHLFANDYDILNFAKEIEFNKIFFKAPETASLYSSPKFNFQIFPLDTPIDFLKFPYLNIADKLRSGIVIAFLKLSPFLSFYEKQTAEEFLKKTMGEKVWNILWQQLFREKYGDYAGKIMASFIWARIKKRTKNLGYVEGGFQILINYLVNLLKELRVNVLTGYGVESIKKRGNKFTINNTLYDVVISTLPTPVLTKVSQTIFLKNYLDRLSKIKYLHALTLILETNKPILEKTYWLNISVPDISIMGIVQHTNFMDKKHYGGKHLVYLGWYLKLEDRKWKMGDRELLNYVKPYLNKIFNFQFPISNFYVFRSLYAQPIFDKNFVKNKPDFITPVKNFFIANLDMTYPYDRGTNYAVKLGKQVAEMI
ncbi:MAG: FAD-dependent oxidoreductase [Candidatus Roizmanbacteria bacterium]|nr:FAD-dependent oxidoreductase [Candidatus Roizmanbacteria bacterium]